jgi:peptide/nickel transport system ATP-binding protein
MRLLPQKSARTVSGSVLLEGQDLLALDEREMRRIRGSRMAMIFQEPMTSLNPLLRVGEQIAEALRIHTGASRGSARATAETMLRLVRIPDPDARLDDFPHQFSGGMRQRVMIAMALVCGPRLLIADEPTTALDVTIQAQILRILVDLKARIGAAIILITHDLGVVAETCQRVIVMYAGRKIEEAEVETLFDRPAHPYTRGLINARPRADGGQDGRLTEIPGLVPSLSAPIVGCAFAPRCPLAHDRCRTESPSFVEIAPQHGVACFAVEALGR